MKPPIPKLVHQIFEARYERGYRYLDRCGDVMLVLEDLLSQETGKTWMPGEMAPRGANIKCPELEITVTFDTQRVGIDQTPVDEADKFQTVCQLVFSTLIGRLDLRSFLRLGSRRILIIGTDSVEEASTLSARVTPAKDWPTKAPEGFGLTEAEIVNTFETQDKTFGYRFGIQASHKYDAPLQLDDRLKLPPRFQSKGQHAALIEQIRNRKIRAEDPAAGLKIDIDFYSVGPAKPVIPPFLDQCDKLQKSILDPFIQGMH